MLYAYERIASLTEKELIKIDWISNYIENVGYKELTKEELIEIIDKKKNSIYLYPEIRIYNQPNILTSEADIKSTIFFDKFLVINLLKGEEIFNVRYQKKQFMIWIWISTCLISIGGILGIFKRL